MDISKALALSGAPGRFAWTILALAYINFFLCVWNDIFPGVYSATPDHHCRLPDGLTLNDSVPVDERGEFSRCEVYVNYSSESGETTPCPNGWHYTVEAGETTVPTEWDFVCDKKYMNSLSTSLYYVGIVLGSLIFGTLSDRVGRRPVLLLCLFAPLFAGSLIYFAESFVVFVSLRFVIGMLKQGLQINSFVLAMEQFTTGKHLGVIAAILESPWPVGGTILSVMAWAVKDWRIIQVIIMLPCVLGLAYFWMLPESLRWQMSTGRYSEAEKTIRFAAKINNVNLDDKFKGSELKSLLTKCEEAPEEEIKYQLFDVFRFPKIRTWTFILCLIWISNSCTAYSIILSVHKLPGNRYVSLGIANVVEIPAIILVGVFANRIKRRLCLSFSCIATGIFCLATAFTPYTTDDGVDIGWLVYMFVYLAKFCTSITWTVISLITCEIYPTVMRSIGFGVCLFACKCGSIIAPQILFMGDSIVEWLPMVILGVATIISGIMCLLLPETLGAGIIDTVEEAEKRTCVIDLLKRKLETGRRLNSSSNGLKSESFVL